jgi:hypothetical protein
VYADTSVFGGCFDPEFEAASWEFFREVREGRFVLIVSDLTVGFEGVNTLNGYRSPRIYSPKEVIEP